MQHSEQELRVQTSFDIIPEKVLRIRLNQEVAEEFVAEYLSIITRIVENQLHKVSGTPQEIHDVVWDAISRIIEKIDLYRREKGVFSSWVIAITYRYALNEMRNRRRRQGKEFLYADTFPDQDADFFLSQAETPEEAMIRSGELEWLRAAVRELLPSWQQALCLQYVEDLSQAQIAEILETTTDGVKSQKWRAIQQLREKYEAFAQPDSMNPVDSTRPTALPASTNNEVSR